jgi:2-polyprenyl-3-methyl-5-hydroxy-6-metoxy-1,4-benzoquinol methylase
MAVDATRYWEDRHASEESLDTVGWAGLGRAFNGRMYDVRRHVFRRVVQARVPIATDIKVLDIGSGTGFYLDIWSDLGVCRIEGSDLSQRAVERLRAAYPDTPIHQLDLGADNPPALGGYDVVSAMDVLFHIVDDHAYARAVASLARLVVPGGHVVISENLLADRVERAPSQVSRSEAEILELLRSVGLQPVSRTPMFVLLNAPVDSSNVWLQRWWTLVTEAVSRNEAVGSALGTVLWPVELVALRLARRGPSTKLLVCRRIGPS